MDYKDLPFMIEAIDNWNPDDHPDIDFSNVKLDSTADKLDFLQSYYDECYDCLVEEAYEIITGNTTAETMSSTVRSFEEHTSRGEVFNFLHDYLDEEDLNCLVNWFGNNHFKLVMDDLVLSDLGTVTHIAKMWDRGDIALRADEVGVTYDDNKLNEMMRWIAEDHNAEIGLNWESIDIYIENFERDWKENKE